MILKIIKKHKTFYYTCCMLWLLGSIPLFFFSQRTIFLFFNQNNHTLLDSFFSSITILGNALIYIFVLIILLLFKVKKTKIISGTLSLLFISIIIQYIKRYIFTDNLRPSKLITDFSLHFIEGVHLHIKYSFPSGHAAIIFSLICFIILTADIQRAIEQFLLLLIACSIAYSRVYLAQHFYIDIYIGSMIGVFVTTFTHWKFYIINISNIKKIV